MGCQSCLSLWMFSLLPILLALFVYLLDYLTELFRLEMADVHRCILAGVNKSIATDDGANIAQ